ncbi:MAG: cytochrome c oxidase assembly protein [Alphaproteobacteria bacterium]
MAAKYARTVGPLVVLVAVMLGLAFASVPLYRLFCQVTGFGGTPQVRGAAPALTQTTPQNIGRPFKIEFNADVDPHLPWQFHPEDRDVSVHTGRPFLIYYQAKNMGQTPIVGTATFNVTPLKAARYFHKIQCFCFKEQQIQPGASKRFPVSFYVDPAILKDPFMDDVTSITLSYTFFEKKQGS